MYSRSDLSSYTYHFVKGTILEPHVLVNHSCILFVKYSKLESDTSLSNLCLDISNEVQTLFIIQKATLAVTSWNFERTVREPQVLVYEYCLLC